MAHLLLAEIASSPSFPPHPTAPREANRSCGKKAPRRYMETQVKGGSREGSRYCVCVCLCVEGLHTASLESPGEDSVLCSQGSRPGPREVQQPSPAALHRGDSQTAPQLTYPTPPQPQRLWVGTGPKIGVRDHELGPKGWTQKEEEERD